MKLRFEDHGPLCVVQLEGDEIPLLARIVAICDSFDAMSSSRTYRRAMPRDKVFAEMIRCQGTQFDPSIIPVFIGMDLTEYDRLLARDAGEAAVDDRRAA
jgi:HD-GYP domain-containing protein (c-di-GMP phosphodiesterase class II)